MNDLFRYDYTFMMAEVVGEYGATEAELAELQPRLNDVHQDFLYQKDQDQLGFVRLPYDRDTVVHVQSLAKRVRDEYSTLLVLGIGGSDLGARALHGALNHTHYNQLPDQTHRLYFAGANTDPKELADVLDLLDWEETAVCVISKSGDTVETMAAFAYVRQRLVEAVGEAQAKHQIIVLTDVEKGSLRALADREGYDSLVVPSDVGGRFSVLSTVGLFPAAYVGIDIEGLLEGARETDERMTASPVGQNPALLYAALQYLGYTKRQQRLSVLMPYAEGLRGLAQWYRQLWAESLGKREDVNGRDVYVGPTPVAALGATDQHSQIQLYNEGPFDKLITFIRVEEPARSLSLPSTLEDFGGLQYLAGLEFGELLQAEAQGTAIALAQHGRPNGTIVLPQLTEQSLGGLLYFFEVACAYSGGLYRVNAYDQPGVEAGKLNLAALLGKPGMDAHRQELERWLEPKRRLTV